jgi:hypothetical protein
MACAPDHEPHAGRNYPEANHVHATHAHIDREPQQVTPRERGQQGEGDDDAVAPERSQGCRGARIENRATPGIPKLLCDTSRYLIGILTGHRRSAIVGT